MRKSKIIETIVKMQNIEVANANNLQESLNREVTIENGNIGDVILKNMHIRNVMHDCQVRADILERLFKKITHGSE